MAGPIIGTMPRPSVTSPSARMKPPASRTPRCRQPGASRPTPPMVSMAGNVPRPKAAMVRQPDSASKVLAAWATMA